MTHFNPRHCRFVLKYTHCHIFVFYIMTILLTAPCLGYFHNVTNIFTIREFLWISSIAFLSRQKPNHSWNYFGEKHNSTITLRLLFYMLRYSYIHSSFMLFAPTTRVKQLKHFNSVLKTVWRYFYNEYIIAGIRIY